MSARAWEAILAAWSDLDALVAAALPSGAGDGDAGLEARLGKLRDDLSTRLLGQLIPRLRSILTAEGSASVDAVVQQVIVPLTIHLDERVLGRLPARLGPAWSRLQEDVIHSDDGGVRFYETLDALLASTQPPALVLEAYLFCLCEGFFGRYVDEPEQVTRYKDRIAQRLPAPPATTGKGAATGSASTTPTAAPKVLPAAVYYVGAVLAAVLAIFLLRALAR